MITFFLLLNLKFANPIKEKCLLLEMIPDCQIEILLKMVSLESSYNGDQGNVYNHPSDCNW